MEGGTASVANTVSARARAVSGGRSCHSPPYSGRLCHLLQFRGDNAVPAPVDRAVIQDRAARQLYAMGGAVPDGVGLAGQLATLALGQAAPHAETLITVQGVLQAFSPDLARRAHSLSRGGRLPLLRKEDVG